MFATRFASSVLVALILSMLGCGSWTGQALSQGLIDGTGSTEEQAEAERLDVQRLALLNSHSLNDPEIQVRYGSVLWQLGVSYELLSRWEEAKSAYVDLFSLRLPKDALSNCAQCVRSGTDESIQGDFERLMEKIGDVEKAERRKIKNIRLPSSRDFYPELPRILRIKKWGYLDKSGKWAIKPQFDDANPFSDGLGGVRIKNDFGFVDKEGMFVIQPELGGGRDFSEGLAAVPTWPSNSKIQWGFIDKTGKFVIKPRFNTVGDFSQGLARASTGEDRWGFLDRRGLWVIGPKYEAAASFRNGFALVSDGRSQFVINKSGQRYNVSIDFYCGQCSEGLAVFQARNGKFGFASLYTGVTVVKAEFDSVQEFSEGLAAVKLNDKFGYINPRGNKVIQLDYDGARDFHEGLAAVRSGGRSLFIDKRGRVAIDQGFDLAGDFSDGLAWVRKGKQEFFIDQSGRQVFQLAPNWYRASQFKDGLMPLAEMDAVSVDKYGLTTGAVTK